VFTALIVLLPLGLFTWAESIATAVAYSVVIDEDVADASATGSVEPVCRVDVGIAGDTRGKTSRA
jgi:hypothetical protein